MQNHSCAKDKKLKNKNKHIKITVADFEVETDCHELKDVEECMNRLISKNKDFAKCRRQKVLLERSGWFG